MKKAACREDELPSPEGAQAETEGPPGCHRKKDIKFQALPALRLREPPDPHRCTHTDQVRMRQAVLPNTQLLPHPSLTHKDHLGPRLLRHKAEAHVFHDLNPKDLYFNILYASSLT